MSELPHELQRTHNFTSTKLILTCTSAESISHRKSNCSLLYFLYFGSNATNVSYSWKCTYCITKLYSIYTSLFNIGNFVFWNHWVRVYSLPQLTYLSDMKFIKNCFTEISAFVEILKQWKYGKSSKSIALRSCTFRRFCLLFRFVCIWVLFVLWLDLWFPMFRI